MTRAGLTEKLLDIKREKGWTWKYICEQIGGMSPIMVTGAIIGQHKLTKPQAANAAKLFGLSKGEQALMNEVPMRGTATPMPPTDPLIYRFYELILVNGPALNRTRLVELARNGTKLIADGKHLAAFGNAALTGKETPWASKCQ